MDGCLGLGSSKDKMSPEMVRLLPNSKVIDVGIGKNFMVVLTVPMGCGYQSVFEQ